MADYASKGVANTGLGLGIAGTALGLLNGGGGLLGGGSLGGLLNLGGGTTIIPESQMPVTRGEMELVTKLAEKESRIGLLEADKYTDGKIVEVYTQLNGQIRELEGEVRRNKDEQYAINLQQAVLNGTTGATIGCIQNQVNALMGLTRLVVPNSSICPGWGEATVSVTTTPATT